MTFEDENLEIAHELRACGGDCPRCQQERAEQRDESEYRSGLDPDCCAECGDALNVEGYCPACDM
jgi:hypothetical protein